MLEISFDIQRVQTDEELAHSGPMTSIDKLLQGAIIFGDSGLRIERVPLVYAMQGLVRSVHLLVFYSTGVLLSLDLSGSSAPMRRDGDVVEIHWGGHVYRFQLVELGVALGRAVTALVGEIGVMKPDYGPGTPAFSEGGQELFDAVAGYKWP